MIIPEGYQWATQAHSLLEEEMKTLGYFTTKIAHKDHLGSKYSVITLLGQEKENLGFVYVHENPNAGCVFAEFRYVKARPSTLFTGKVVPTKLFSNHQDSLPEFPEWVVERYAGAPKKVSTTTSFFKTRSTKKVRKSESRAA